jgi:dihydrodipicolinate synthase/N-acetylneuraminate lyase
MAFQELSQPLRGIIPPMVTPLAGPNQLDHAGLERLIDYMVAGGVHGLFVLGSTGEGPSLSHQLRRQLIERTCAHVEGRVPVLVGITDPCYAESIALAQDAAEAGADAVVVAPPYYYPIGQSALLAYTQRLAREVPLPLVIYNMPALTRISFDPLTIQQLMAEPTIVGVKDSSGDLEYFRALRELTRERPDWSLMIGQEHLLVQALELGGDGGVCGGANVFPQLFTQIYDATLANSDTAIAEQGDVLPHLVDQADRLANIFRPNGESITASSVIRGLKAALATLGVCGDVVALPLESCSAAERHRIDAVLAELGLTPRLARQGA